VRLRAVQVCIQFSFHDNDDVHVGGGGGDSIRWFQFLMTLL
jgi:hypothetical protein